MTRCLQATNLLLDNAVNLATVKSIGDFILFLAKLAVASSSATVAFTMIEVSESGTCRLVL